MSGRKMTAGNSKPFEPTNIDDMTNVKSLDFNKPYPEFNYDKYIDRFKQSNFVGGGSKKMNNFSKTVSNLIKNMYVDYKKGKASKMKYMKPKKSMKGGVRSVSSMRGGAGEDDMFLLNMKEMKDVSNLEYQEPYKYSEMNTISRMPRSNFQSLGKS